MAKDKILKMECFLGKGLARWGSTVRTLGNRNSHQVESSLSNPFW